MTYSKFGDLVNEFRTIRDKTLYDVAKAADVSHTYISQIENGKKLPSLKVLFPLVKYLGSKNDKGYRNKMDNIEYNEMNLLEAYGKYKDIDKDGMYKLYMEYLKEDVIKTLDQLDAMKNKITRVDKKTDEIVELEYPYFNIKWLLTQDRFEVYYGNEYDFTHGLSKENPDIKEFLQIYNSLSDEDIKTIHDLIEAFLSNKYSKFD